MAVESDKKQKRRRPKLIPEPKMKFLEKSAISASGILFIISLFILRKNTANSFVLDAEDA